MRVWDDENHYPLWCRLAGHRWRRPYFPANYTTSWRRSKSCHRCEHILMGVELIRQRWIRSNAEAKAAGCMCGRPATHVKAYGGTIGGIPSEVWTCEEHRDVGRWTQVGEGEPWVPSGPRDPGAEAWRVA